MVVRLVALDIDGTVVDVHDANRNGPPAEIRGVVADLSDAGVEVVLASGRMIPGTLKVARARPENAGRLPTGSFDPLGKG